MLDVTLAEYKANPETYFSEAQPVLRKISKWRGERPVIVRHRFDGRQPPWPLSGHARWARHFGDDDEAASLKRAGHPPAWKSIKNATPRPLAKDF
jgi:hypothetical protein